jgi:hypothetical protein
LNDIILKGIDLSGRAVFSLQAKPDEEYTVYYYTFDKKVISVCKI